ncbi:MAG: pentapeptide repeat-containing protein [Deltaproteobacteria bacterium]|nr:pentapeptide repeat-containing protein [Deltaproteobacteria bacterium]
METALDIATLLFLVTFVFGLALAGILVTRMAHYHKPLPPPNRERLPTRSLDRANQGVDTLKSRYYRAAGSQRARLAHEIHRLEIRVTQIQEKTADDQYAYYQLARKQEKIYQEWKELHDQIPRLKKEERENSRKLLLEASQKYSAIGQDMRDEWHRAAALDDLFYEELKNQDVFGPQEPPHEFSDDEPWPEENTDSPTETLPPAEKNSGAVASENGPLDPDTRVFLKEPSSDGSSEEDISGDTAPARQEPFHRTGHGASPENGPLDRNPSDSLAANIPKPPGVPRAPGPIKPLGRATLAMSADQPPLPPGPQPSTEPNPNPAVEPHQHISPPGQPVFIRQTQGEMAQADFNQEGPPKTGLLYTDSTLSLESTDNTLSEANLSRCAFPQVGFTGVHQYVHCDFSEADLEGITLKREARPHRFDRCNLHGVNFANSRLDSVIFTDCDLSATYWNNARLSRVKFESCSLDEVQWLGADLSRSVMDPAMLETTDFTTAGAPPHNYLRPTRPDTLPPQNNPPLTEPAAPPDVLSIPPNLSEPE